MYLRDMVRYVCQTICNIICSYIYIYLSIYSKILKVFCQTLPQEKCRSHGHLRQHRFHQETQLLSVVRRHLSLVLESLSPQLRIFDIYMCIRLMQ